MFLIEFNDLNYFIKYIKKIYFYFYFFNMFFFIFRRKNYFRYFKKRYIKKLKKKKLNNYFFFKFNVFFFSKKFQLKNFIFLKKKIALWKNRFNLKKFFLFYHWRKERYNFRKLKKKIFMKKNLRYYILFKRKKKRKFRNKYPYNFKKFFFRTIFKNQNFLKSFFFKKKVRKKYLLHFIKSKRIVKIKYLMWKFELMLYNIVARTKLLLSYKDIIYLTKKGLVYVNNNIMYNPLHILNLYDIIQIVLFKNIYIYNKKIFSYLVRRLKRIQFKVWKIKSNKFNFYKEKTKHIPNWIINYRFFKVKIPNYLEIDYLTLSAVIIKLPRYVFDFNNYHIRYLMIYLFKIYKWKLSS